MHSNLFLNEIIILLVATVFVVSLLRRFNISPIIGYLTTGMLIGPHALRFIDDVEGVSALGRLGVVFLMFSIGLKIPLQRFKVLAPYVFGLGTAQMVVTGCWLAGLSYYFVGSFESAAFIGIALSLSSTAVAMEVLSERGESASRYGRVSFSILLLQDLTVVVLLMLLSTAESKNSGFMYTIIYATGKAAFALFVIAFIGRVVLQPVYRWISTLKKQELFAATTLLIILATGHATSYVGLSVELGAFLAGLLLAETEYKHQVEADIQPYHSLLLGLFFTSMGMNIDLALLSSHLFSVVCIVVGLVLSKTILMMAIGRFFSLSLSQSIRVGLLLGTGGEFVFILFDPAVAHGLVEPHMSQLLSLSVGVSMILTPFLAMIGKKADDWLTAQASQATLDVAEDEVIDLKNHVIVAGFGRLGEMIGQVLAQEIIPFVAIDHDMVRVSDGRSRGYPVFFGDAKQVSVMRILGAERARAVVVCLDGGQASMRMGTLLRRFFPRLEVCVRLNERRYLERLTKLGVAVVMPENLEPFLQMAAITLAMVGMPEDRVNPIIHQFRDDYRRTEMSYKDKKNE